MSYPCDTCGLDCRYKEWRLEHPPVTDGKPEVATVEFLRALSKRNSKCPAEDESYSKFMEECGKRGAFNRTLEVCNACRDRLKIFTMKDVSIAPRNCPRLDPLKEIGERFSKMGNLLTILNSSSLAGLSKVMEQINETQSNLARTLAESMAFRIPTLNRKMIDLHEPAIITPELISPLRSTTVEVNVQLLARIHELERLLAEKQREVEVLEKENKDLQTKLKERPDYIT